MQPPEAKPDEPKSFLKRDRLLELEAQARQLWESERFHEREVDPARPKFFANFPYPYMNGRLHLGHAFSMSKPEFVARYKTLKGFNALFPFGFHCTGMPISAASLKLKEEMTAKFTREQLEQRVRDRAAALAGPEEAREKFFREHPMTQYEIMVGNHVRPEEMEQFWEPRNWLTYFPPKGKEDLQKFGLAADFRRSFITTAANPFYDSFIQWQFRKLQKNGFLQFGQRPSIYSEKDQQMCADHERAEGEGVLPQEYTLIKLRLLETKSPLLAKLLADGRAVVLPAATLRPETMYGQTNCFVLPDAEYGVFEMANKEVWVCSEHSMRNLSFQGKTAQFGKSVQLGAVLGQEVVGSAVRAPLASFERVFVWPMLSISMSKGTGVVTSVPSDAPDDYAVLNELRKKKAFREKFGLTDEQVLPFEPVPIIKTAKYDTLAAVKAFEAFKVQSMNDHERLKAAKEDVYTDGFYSGVMAVGDFAGKKVQEAKPLIKAQMVAANDADVYFEPESRCVSRSGDVCVVALCDQWYITYGTDEVREKLKEFVRSDRFNSFNETIKNELSFAIDWLKNWGCSRSFGLGSTLPADPQYLIESLSDSTIYMAYYTVANLLHRDLYGQELAKYSVPAADFADEDWDFVFLKAERSPASKVPAALLEEMRTSFAYWYPFDLRCSGKDLIKNHLTMSLYNHEFIWGKAGMDMLPRGIFCNGWVLVDGEKMSKSKGNFLLVGDTCDSITADVLRLTLANAGDSLTDANVEIKASDKVLLKLATLEGWLQETKKLMPTFREESPAEVEFFDRVFENRVKIIANNAEAAYEKMLFRDVVKEAFYNMAHAKDEYKYLCGNHGPRKDLVRFFIEVQLLLLYPITPHFSEMMWLEVARPLMSKTEASTRPAYISRAAFPSFPPASINHQPIKEMEYLERLGESLRSSCEKILKKKPGTKFAKTYFIVASKFQDWQVACLKYLQTVAFDAETKAPKNDWKKEVKELFKDPKVATKAFQFVSFKLKEFTTLGAGVFSHEVTLDEAAAIRRHIDIILKDSYEIGEVVVLPVEEAAASKDKNLSQNVDSCKPGEPLIAFEFK